MSNSLLADTLVSNFHVLLVWCIGLFWAVRYRDGHQRISWFSGIALFLLSGNVFMLPILYWQIERNSDIIRVTAIWSSIRIISETIAWILLLGATFDWQNQRVLSQTKQSEYTIKCPQCRRRNSIYSETCADCQTALFQAEGDAGWLMFAKHYFDWNRDLSISKPRLRGRYRAVISLIVLFIGGLTATIFQSAGISGTVVLIGFTGLPCAIAEMITDRNWDQVIPILRLGLLTIFAFAFAFILWLLIILSMRGSFL